MPNELDPSDVYPPSNLPPGSAQWGRSIQGDVTKLKTAVTVQEQMLANANRGTASSLANQASQIQRLSEKVQTYRRVWTGAELTAAAGHPYPLPDQSFGMQPPSWATTGTVLAYSFPAWSGTVSSGGSVDLTVFPNVTWNSNTPVIGASAKIFNDGGGLGTRLLLSTEHSHPIEVKGGSSWASGVGYENALMYTDLRWTYEPGTTFAGITLTMDISVLWN